MMITGLVVDILKLGLTGLVFLLMYLGFRLLQQEQQKSAPNRELLKRASVFVWQSIVIACLVAAVEIGHRVFDLRSAPSEEVKNCLKELNALVLVSQHPAQTTDALRSAIRSTSKICERAEGPNEKK